MIGERSERPNCGDCKRPSRNAWPVCPACNQAICEACAPDHPCDVATEGALAKVLPLALWGIFQNLPPVRRWEPVLDLGDQRKARSRVEMLERALADARRAAR